MFQPCKGKGKENGKGNSAPHDSDGEARVPAHIQAQLRQRAKAAAGVEETREAMEKDGAR